MLQGEVREDVNAELPDFLCSDPGVGSPKDCLGQKAGVGRSGACKWEQCTSYKALKHTLTRFVPACRLNKSPHDLRGRRVKQMKSLAIGSARRHRIAVQDLNDSQNVGLARLGLDARQTSPPAASVLEQEYPRGAAVKGVIVFRSGHRW